MTTATATLTIKKIETRPELDPYHRSTGKLTHTVIELYPEDRELYVVQEYDDNATPSDEWHGLTLTWGVDGWPTEETMRRWLEDHLDRFAAIADGWERYWDGHNHVGILSEPARHADDKLREQLNWGIGGDQYEYWAVEDWIDEAMRSEVHADTTDDEIREMARDWAMTEPHIVLSGDTDDMIRIATEYRDGLREE